MATQRTEQAPPGTATRKPRCGVVSTASKAPGSKPDTARPSPGGRTIGEPPDEGPVESLGRSVGEVVLGSDEEDREAHEQARR